MAGSLLSSYLRAEDLIRSGKTAEAKECWRSGAIAVESSDQPRLDAWFLSHGGAELFNAKHMDASDDFYREAMEAARESTPLVRGEILRQWAGMLEAREDFARAENYYHDELIEWKQLDAKLLIAQNLNELGRLFWTQGRFSEAKSSFLESSTITRGFTAAALQRALSYNNLGIIYQESGDLGTADKYYRLALAIARRHLPGTYFLSQFLTDIGTLSLRRGNVALAEQYHREALSIARKLHLSSEIADILDNIVYCRVDRGDLRGAETYEEQALSIREQSGASLPVASSLNALGNIARLQGRLKAAEEYYRRAAEMTSKLSALAFERIQSLDGLGDVLHDAGNFSAAEQQYKEALALLEQFTPRSVDHAETLASLAETQHAEGHLQDAEESYRRTLNDLEYQAASVGGPGEGEARYRAKHAAYYREFVDLLVEENRPGDALEALERSRARTLLEMLVQARIDIRQGVDARLLAQERDLRYSLNAKSQYRIRLLNEAHTEEKLKSLDREIADLRQHYEQMQADIRANSPGYAALTQPQPLRIQDIQALLDPDTVLLEYSLGKKRSWLWIVGENSVQARMLPGRAMIEDLSRRLYRALTARMRKVNQDPKLEVARWNAADISAQALARRLSHAILSPAAGAIRGKRLLIVKDGALQYLPFSAIAAPEDPNVPLLIRHEVVNLPSASVLAEIRQAGATRARPPKEVAVLADAVFDPQDERVAGSSNVAKPHLSLLSSGRAMSRSAADVGLGQRGGFRLGRLPFSRDEAEAITSIIPRESAWEALDFDASRASALSSKLAQYRIVHFATHGFLDSKQPELSGLVLSLVDRQGKPQEGFLSLEDVYNLKLPVDMVVLSGCRTALGEEISGEGLMGLTRGFMYAGASRVVASLWSVDDYTTAELMASFYRAMERDKMRPAAALRKAQVEIWKHTGWQAPYYWAGFELQGEWR
jgi:CHAT domain-containing protein/Tfp pilus assembly protein PilF